MCLSITIDLRSHNSYFIGWKNSIRMEIASKKNERNSVKSTIRWRNLFLLSYIDVASCKFNESFLTNEKRKWRAHQIWINYLWAFYSLVSSIASKVIMLFTLQHNCVFSGFWWSFRRVYAFRYGEQQIGEQQIFRSFEMPLCRTIGRIAKLNWATHI